MMISKRCRNMELLSIYIFMKNYTLSMPCVHQFFFRVNVYSLQYFTSWFIALRRIQLNHFLTLKIHHQIKASVINPKAEVFWEQKKQFFVNCITLVNKYKKTGFAMHLNQLIKDSTSDLCLLVTFNCAEPHMYVEMWWKWLLVWNLCDNFNQQHTTEQHYATIRM